MPKDPHRRPVKNTVFPNTIHKLDSHSYCRSDNTDIHYNSWYKPGMFHNYLAEDYKHIVYYTAPNHQDHPPPWHYH